MTQANRQNQRQLLVCDQTAGRELKPMIPRCILRQTARSVVFDVTDCSAMVCDAVKDRGLCLTPSLHGPVLFLFRVRCGRRPEGHDR